MTIIPSGQEAVSTRWTVKYADIRHVFDSDGNPWFVAKDVCDYLEISNAAQAYARIDDEDKQLYPIAPKNGSTQDMITVSEPGLYQLIFMSAKPEAAAFRRWVYRDLLPELRKSGQYKLRGSGGQPLMPALTAVPSTRFGRQPFLDVLRARGLKNNVAIKMMNELDIDVPKINTSWMNQARGVVYVQPGLAYRSSAWLGLPVEDLFTESSRSRLPPR